jgi:uncharacterized membrane protein YfcA
MFAMVKPLLIGALASVIVGLAIVIGLHTFDASGEIGAVVFVLGACIGGLIGAQVASHLPPPKQHR